MLLLWLSPLPLGPCEDRWEVGKGDWAAVRWRVGKHSFLKNWTWEFKFEYISALDPVASIFLAVAGDPNTIESTTQFIV